MTANNGHIFIVDDDPSVNRSLTRLVISAGYTVQSYTSAKDFLHSQPWLDTSPACLLLDQYMPELNGLGLQRILKEVEASLPIIFLSGNSNVPDSVEAMKLGAIDFLIKPVSEQELFKAVKRAHSLHLNRCDWDETIKEASRNFALLSEREQEVMGHVLDGLLNKQIAYQLGIVEKTVKVHRAHIMQKMNVRSVAKLARLVERINQNAPEILPEKLQLY